MTIQEQIKIFSEGRRTIQDIDEQIVELLNIRFFYCKNIMKLKRANGKPLFDPEVEAQKIKTLSLCSDYKGMVEAIWPVIMCYARTLE